MKTNIFYTEEERKNIPIPHDLCHGRSSSRAPSSDRIPVELFQILKDDAVKSAALNMQYAICTQYAICQLPAPELFRLVVPYSLSGSPVIKTTHANGYCGTWPVSISVLLLTIVYIWVF